MSAIETHECIVCEGRGEVWSGRYEFETNAPIGIRCGNCDGHGVTSVEQVGCDMCDQPTTLDVTCPHRTSWLCPACSCDVCGDCRSTVSCDAAEEAGAWWLDAS